MMLSFRKLKCIGLILMVGLGSFAVSADEPVFDRLVNTHRQIILLLAETDGNEVLLQQNTHIARNLYYRKREIVEALDEAWLSSKELRHQTVEQLLTAVQSESLHQADLLAFIDVVDSILYINSEDPSLSLRQLTQLEKLESDIEKIQTAYKDDLSELYGKLDTTRGKTIEPWSDYLSFIESQYSPSDIRKTFNEGESDLASPDTRGASGQKKGNPNLVWGFGIPEKTVVLTFDDGPHFRNTDAILDTLKEYQAHAYFFTVGKNFGKVTEGKPVLNANAKKLTRALEEGHLLGNHSFTHRVLTKLDDAERKAELTNTNLLLKSVSGVSNVPFRPPYGSKNDELQTYTVSQGMRSVMWNIDSQDWADPIPASIVKRVMDNLEKKKRGIILFHDIHKQTVQALPLLLAELKKEGYSFVDIDGKPFVIPEKKRAVENDVVAEKSNASSLYRNSWAVVIGVNKYDYWPQLSYAVNDAQGVAETLEKQFGFQKDHVFTLFDKDATRANITEMFSETLADPRRVKENDRVFVFYAGHGMTRTLPSGRDLGYIIPVDAKLDTFHSGSISMTHLQDFSEMIPAKHVYFVMDSCYSGIALTRAGAKSAKNNHYLEQITSRHARQILTAGGADQEVADGGPGGHSIFTWTLLRGLSGEADLDNNKIITASELGAFVAPAVSNNSNQTPAFGNLVGSAGGEFVFELIPTALESASLSETEKLEQQVKTQQNKILSLEQQIASLEKLLANNTAGSRSAYSILELTPKERMSLAKELHDKGLADYQNKNYQDALSKLKQAVVLNPVNPTIVNNYGFVLYRDGQHAAALDWLVKTIELDAQRIPVYVNIADTLVELGREADALAYYRHYIDLFPDSPLAGRVNEFINTHSPKS